MLSKSAVLYYHLGKSDASSLKSIVMKQERYQEELDIGGAMFPVNIALTVALIP